MTPDPASLASDVEDATAQLLIELAFLVPRGTDMATHPIAERLASYKRVIEERAKAASLKDQQAQKPRAREGHLCVATATFGDVDTICGLPEGHPGQHISPFSRIKWSQPAEADVLALTTAREELREALWLNHGCGCLLPYGDDGEMQCCGVDFKRTPIVDIVRQLNVKSIQKAANEVAALTTALDQQEKLFPVMGGPAVPWVVIAPHERQAQRNHGQSIQRLADRGGLSPCELLAVLEDRQLGWEGPNDEAAKPLVQAIVDADLKVQILALTTALAEAKHQSEAQLAGYSAEQLYAELELRQVRPAGARLLLNAYGRECYDEGAKSLQSELAALRQQLQTYGQHKPDCQTVATTAYRRGDGSCTCGFTAALQGSTP
jgi:hypothetical protein